MTRFLTLGTSFRVLLLVLFSSLSLTLFTSFYVNDVHATSSYDDIVTNTTTLKIQHYDGTVQDHTSDWDSLVSTACDPSVVTAFTTQESIGHYAVVQGYGAFNGGWSPKAIVIAYGGSTASFYDTPAHAMYVDTDPAVHFIILGFNSSSYTVNCADNAQSLTNYPLATPTSSTYYQPFIIGYTINYPSGYAGATPAVPPFTGTYLRPNIISDVNNLDLKLGSALNSDVNAQYPDYYVSFFVTNASIDGTGSSCDPAFSTTAIGAPTGFVDVPLPCKGVYSVTAQFVNYDGSYLPDWGSFRAGQSSVNLDINGLVYSVDTATLSCDSDGYCTNPYDGTYVDETCDITHVSGCVNNAINALEDALGISKTAANPTGSPLVSFQTDSHGLQSIISAPLTAINSLTSATCTPISLPIPFVSTTFTLPCYTSIYESSFGTAFTLYQTVVTGVISYYVIVGLLEIVKNFKDPKKDQIEVLKL